LAGQIKRAAHIIREGGVVAFPTETVYGLGANAFNPLAVAQIFSLKERPSFDPLIVHIAHMDDLERLSSRVDEMVWQLAKCFWPGPLSIVMPKRELVPDIVTSGLPTVAVRMPDHPIALEMIRQAKCPVAAPSANKFGQLSPTSAAHVRKQLPNVDFILDGGPTQVGVESTIVTIEEGECMILRPGRITPEDIRHALPRMQVHLKEKNSQIIAPGLLNSHYSPQKPLFIRDGSSHSLPSDSGLILHHFDHQKCNARRVIYTSGTGNNMEIAANLFSALHAMEDDAHIGQIYIDAVPESGLGIAIMDRMK